MPKKKETSVLPMLSLIALAMLAITIFVIKQEQWKTMMPVIWNDDGNMERIREKLERVENTLDIMNRGETTTEEHSCYNNILSSYDIPCDGMVFPEWCSYIQATAHYPKYEDMDDRTWLLHFYARYKCDLDSGKCSTFCNETFNWQHERLYPWTTNYNDCMRMCDTDF
jgi:hypothetical protein